MRIRARILAVSMALAILLGGAPFQAPTRAADPTYLPFPLPPALAPVQGQDLWHIDMDTGQFIQGSDGHVHLYLRNAPVGTPNTSGWRFRDPSLSKRQPDGSFAPASLPFSLDIAQNSGAHYLVSIANEGAAMLHVGLLNHQGKVPPPIAGRVAGAEVVYASRTPATSPDVAVQATDSGFSLHVILHNARQSPSITLGLTLPSGERLAREASGNIQVTRPITGYSDSGPTPIITLGPEYVIEHPVALDDTPGATAIAHASLAAISLGPLAAGAQDVTITPDVAWLRDRARRFPVTLTIPVITALAASETGIFTTLGSCTHASARLTTDMIVGVSGHCSFQGSLSFAFPPMLPAPTIVSATLGLYAPDQPAATGIQVYRNASPSFPFVAPSALDQHAGPFLPTVAQGASGIPEEATGSPWHTWDVTAIVRRWLGDRRDNGGLTLRGRGELVRFAWPLDAGTGSGQTAPLLSIVFG